MIINSDFTDYYDILRRSLRDPRIIYNRQTKEDIILIDARENKTNTPMLSKLEQHCGYVLVGRYAWRFCTRYGVQWDRASFLKSMREENNNSRKRYYYFGSPKDFLPAFPDSMTDESMRMNEVIRNEIGRTDTRINKDAPVIIIEHNPNRWQLYVMDYYHRRSIRIQENGRLSDIEFHKVLDPYMVFQEIGQYISGVIGGSFPATVNISDESMAKKKGFDKQSFRKASSKKARKPKH